MVSDLKKTGTTVTKVTIGNTLHDHGFQSASTDPELSRYRTDDPEEDWEKVMWLDETKMKLLHINATHHVWSEKNAELPTKSIIPMVKHGGRSIMI